MQTTQAEIHVTKNSGVLAPFSVAKLRHSLERSGAKKGEVNYIICEVKKMLYPGISTKKIYKKAFSLLRKASRPAAAKYKLKKAIFELGPSGFPFERYVAAVLNSEGYRVKVGQILQGHCIKHEVDIIAENKEELLTIECKFHSESRRNSDVKVPLYFQSRFLDLEKQRAKSVEAGDKFHQGWIVTNTRFSGDAEQFATCSGLYLLSWNFPEKGNLKERIDASGVHPITCLTTLTRKEKGLLLKKSVVLAKELCDNDKLLRSVGVSQARIKKVMSEAKGLSF